MFDIECQLSVAQAFTATAVSANSYAKGSIAEDMSIGRRVALLVMPVVAAAGGATYTLEAIQATNGALTTGVEVIGSVSATDAMLALGKQVEIPIAQGVMTKKYLGFRCTMTGGTAPTVTLDVYLLPQDEIALNKSFPKALNAAV